MKFTDNDLKRLKELKGVMLQGILLEALLARLEAAECGIFSLETVIRWMRQEARYKNLKAADLVWLESAEITLEAWRNAAGK